MGNDIQARAFDTALSRLEALDATLVEVDLKPFYDETKMLSEGTWLADLASDPVGPNSDFGIYTNFVNLLDICAQHSAGRPVEIVGQPGPCPATAPGRTKP